MLERASHEDIKALADVSEMLLDNIKESEQPKHIYNLLTKIRPNILVITGHDAYFSKKSDIKNIDKEIESLESKYFEVKREEVKNAATDIKNALQKICDELSSDSFYEEAHQKIFEVLQELNDNGTPVDLTILTNRLSDKKILSQVGNVDYLSEILDSVPSASNVEYYINIVKEKMIGRKIIETATEIANDAYISEESIYDV